jgi:hypothetical protein
MLGTTITNQIFHVNTTPLAYKRRGRGGLDPSNHNTTNAHRTYGFYPHGGMNLYKPSCPLRSIVPHIREHPTLKSSHKL